MKIIFIKKVKMYTMNKYQYNQTSVMCIVCIKQLLGITLFFLVVLNVQGVVFIPAFYSMLLLPWRGVLVSDGQVPHVD